MMTWMTRMSFLDTADDLTEAHLAQGIRESELMFEALTIGSAEVPENHPVLQGWIGYERALAAYNVALSIGLAIRGYANPTHLSIAGKVQRSDLPQFELPPWLSDTDILRSHRSNLTRRWPKQYQKLFGVSRRLPYLYPFVDDQGGYRIMVSKHDKELLASGERTLPEEMRARVANL